MSRKNCICFVSPCATHRWTVLFFLRVTIHTVPTKEDKQIVEAVNKKEAPFDLAEMRSWAPHLAALLDACLQNRPVDRPTAGEIRFRMWPAVRDQLAARFSAPTAVKPAPAEVKADASSGEKKRVKILSLDGGGIRGLMEIEMFRAIEEKTGKRVPWLLPFWG